MRRPATVICTICRRQVVPQGRRGRLRLECDRCRKDTRNARDRARRAAKRPDPGREGRHQRGWPLAPLGANFKRVDQNMDALLDAAKGVEAWVWPQALGEGGQRALTLLVLRVLDLERSIRDARDEFEQLEKWAKPAADSPKEVT